jgi:hypothetical protein
MHFFRALNIALQTNQVTAPGERQGWRYCMQCQGLFYTAVSNGVCPVKGMSPHDGSASGDYILRVDDDGDLGQQGRRWCNKCQSLYSQTRRALSAEPYSNMWGDWTALPS